MEDTDARRWTSRKLAAAVCLQVLVTTLLVYGFVSEGVFQVLTIFTWCGYLAGNIGEYWAKR